MNPDFQALMRQAAQLTRSGNLAGAQAAIQAALGGATAPAPAMPTMSGMAATPTTPGAAGAFAAFAAPGAFSSPAPETIDVLARFIDKHASPLPQQPRPAPPVGPGMTAGHHAAAGLRCDYELFVPTPTTARAGPRPLVLMLHGCTQNPADFAAGTRMNELAQAQGFIVLYPAQSRRMNPQGCWNWFKHSHQRRGHGEPELLASLTRSVMQRHGVDPARVYVAGLSAGGAMAAILGHAYPDLFAAVGVHSGVPRGAAHDVASALAAMKDAGASDHPWAHESFRRRSRTADALLPLVPTIVFHGDLDTTVHPRNAELVLEAALGGVRGDEATDQPVTSTEAGRSMHGLPFTRTVHREAGSGLVLAEHWVVHGVGHAWSGGDARGSYTDARGPDASREMLRFFAEHVLPQRDATSTVEALA